MSLLTALPVGSSNTVRISNIKKDAHTSILLRLGNPSKAIKLMLGHLLCGQLLSRTAHDAIVVIVSFSLLRCNASIEK